jgi:hypothetical protein
MLNPLGKITDTAVGVIGSGVRLAASLINSTADHAKGLVGLADEPGQARVASQPGQPGEAREPVDQPSIESMAAAAVERELQQEPVEAAEPDIEADADELLTPSGIPAAGPGFNPDTAETDLHQRDTEPLLDPATVKAVTKESEVLQAAAEPEKH